MTSELQPYPVYRVGNGINTNFFTGSSDNRVWGHTHWRENRFSTKSDDSVIVFMVDAIRTYPLPKNTHQMRNNQGSDVKHEPS